MGRSAPFISIVVPTRNRPELLRYCLKSVALQTFDDFEVIVSDNHTGMSCKHVMDHIADKRFKYVAPVVPLAMHDSWEFACSHATGQYVAVLIDKTVLRPSALEVVYTTIEKHPAEIVSWWNESYTPLDQAGSYDQGSYQPCHRPRESYYYDPRQELERRFRLDVRRGQEGVRYGWGKICFGTYHRDLISRITGAIGRLFYPISPDYTSMLAALAFARSALDVGQPLLISIITNVSTGGLAAQRDEYAFAFLRDLDPSLRILDSLPLQGLYASTHNMVARDYAFMRELVGAPMRNLKLNKRNLILRAREDLDQRKSWQDVSRRTEQYQVWTTYFSQLALTDRIRIRLQRIKPRSLPIRRWRYLLVVKLQMLFPRITELMITNYRRYITGPVIEAKVFDSVISAAQYADDCVPRRRREEARL